MAGPLGGPLRNRYRPKAEFIKSVSGGFGPRNFWQGFGLAAIAFGWAPGRAFAKPVPAQGRIYKVGVGRAWAEKLLARVRLGGYSLWLGPWAGLCEIGTGPRPNL